MPLIFFLIVLYFLTHPAKFQFLSGCLLSPVQHQFICNSTLWNICSPKLLSCQGNRMDSQEVDHFQSLQFSGKSHSFHSLTSRRSWGWALITTNVGCWQMGYTQSRSNFILVNVSRRKSGIGRDNEQFFTDEAALGPIAQIVENRLIRFGERSFNVVNLQRPNRVCGPFCTTFKLARLVEIGRASCRERV